VFEETCMNVEFWKPGKDGERPQWLPNKKTKDVSVPVISSARKFTDHCTVVKLREDIESRTKSELKKHKPNYNEEAATSWFEQLRNGR